MRINNIKVSPSTMGMTSSFNPKREIIIAGYNVTLFYDDGSKRKEYLSSKMPFIPKRSYKGVALGASFFIIIDETYKVYNTSFELKSEIPLEEGEIFIVQEDTFGLKKDKMLYVFNNEGINLDERELGEDELK